MGQNITGCLYRQNQIQNLAEYAVDLQQNGIKTILYAQPKILGKSIAREEIEITNILNRNIISVFKSRSNYQIQVTNKEVPSEFCFSQQNRFTGGVTRSRIYAQAITHKHLFIH